MKPIPQGQYNNWKAQIGLLLQLIEGTSESQPFREGLKDTPDRILKSWMELFSGYNDDPEMILSKTFAEDRSYDEMIVVRNVEFTSFCEHHMLPFIGTACVGYIPSHMEHPARVVGLSKLARLVDCFAKRLQLQERLTDQITEALHKHLNPRGAGCLIRANHLCLGCRGAKKPTAEMVTSSLIGCFKTDDKTRSEFLSLCGVK